MLDGRAEGHHVLEAHPRVGDGTTLLARLQGLPVRRVLTLAVSARAAVLAWCGIVLLAATVVVFGHLLLPARFFYDAAHIATIARRGPAAGQGDQSFIAVGELYNILRLQNSPQLTALLSFLALVAIHTVVFRRLSAGGRTPVLGLVLLLVSLAVGSVYLTTYSKDAVVLLLTVCVLLASPRPSGDLLIVASLLAYAACFRSYWVLVVLGYIAIRSVDRLSRRGWVALLVPFGVLLAVAALYAVLTGEAIDQARMLTNSIRLGSPDASTLIQDYVALPQPWSSMVNGCLNLVLLVLPLPLFVKGGAYYTAIAVVLLGLWASVLTAWLRRRDRHSSPATRPLALLLAFVTTQAIFEPDYGSALRHLSPLLPLLALGVGIVVAGVLRGSSAPSGPERKSFRARGRHSA